MCHILLLIDYFKKVSRVSKMLADEYGTASNIKSRVNRLSVLGAITSVQQRLKLYTKVGRSCSFCYSRHRRISHDPTLTL